MQNMFATIVVSAEAANRCLHLRGPLNRATTVMPFSSSERAERLMTTSTHLDTQNARWTGIKEGF